MHSQPGLSSLAFVKLISSSPVFNGFFTRPKGGKVDNTAYVKTGTTRGRERFAVDIDPLEQICRKFSIAIDILYEQEICASKSETKVAMTSSEDTSFSYFNETYFKKHVIRH